MTTESLSSIFPEAKVVTVKPGDVIVFRASGKLTPEARASAGKMFDEIFGGVEVLILDSGQDISVIRPRASWWRRMFGAKG